MKLINGMVLPINNQTHDPQACDQFKKTLTT